MFQADRWGPLIFYRRLMRMLRLGVRSISRSKLRSTLSISGIVFGVSSVIVMVAVGEGARVTAIDQLKDLGARNIILRSRKPPVISKENEEGQMIIYGLTRSDLERIVSTVPTVVEATPLREHRRWIRRLDKSLDGRVVAITPAYESANKLQLRRGRFLTEKDGREVATVALLAAEAANDLFPLEDPIGRSVRIGEDQYYQVVGVMEPRSPSAGVGSTLPPQDYSHDVYIPFETDRARFGEVVVLQRGAQLNEKVEISQITLSVADVDRVKDTAQIVSGILTESHQQGDTTITVPLDLIEQVEKTQRIFTLVLGTIASISLLVGGIGIMNIMLATVTERTREIGIRRALGAKRRDIVLQFLLETVVLSSIGGALGLFLGITLSRVVSDSFGMRTIVQAWSLLLALAISAAIGLVFGTYPARRAALMDPIHALHHE
jgi:putative ABC transport system permease protein